MVLLSAFVVFYLGGFVCAQSTPAPSPYSVLPPAPDYSDGKFISPNTATTQIFTEGSTLNVSWTSVFEAANLYFIRDGEYNSPVTVAISQSQPWYSFTLKCVDGDCSVPYNFRAVDANGNGDAQRGGGFYTGQFWIRRAVTSSSLQETSSPGVQTANSTTQTTQTARDSPTSSPTSTITSSTSTDAATDRALTSSFTTAPPPRGPDVNGPAIGGGVGAGVVVAALVVGAAILWRRRRKRAQEKDLSALDTSEHGQVMYYPQQRGTHPYAYPPASRVPFHEVESRESKSPIEFPPSDSGRRGNPPVELWGSDMRHGH